MVSKRKYAVGSFVPCSPRHHHCSPAHAALVRGYREERERQVTAFEETTGNYAGDIEHAKATGAQLITFHTWLKAHKRNEHRHEWHMTSVRKRMRNSVAVKVWVKAECKTCDATLVETRNGKRVSRAVT